MTRKAQTALGIALRALGRVRRFCQPRKDSKKCIGRRCPGFIAACALENIRNLATKDDK